jgi:hypothetical protein
MQKEEWTEERMKDMTGVEEEQDHQKCFFTSANIPHRIELAG